MSFIEIFSLFAAMVALALVPSSSVALVVARSYSAGLANGFAVAAGIVCGDLVFVTLAVLGLTALEQALGSFFLILRYLAGGYLIWFGVSLIRSKASFQLENASLSASKLSTSFFAGLALTLGDVKAIFFYASLFPAFVDLATIDMLDVSLIALITVIAVGGVKLGYACLARVLVSSVTHSGAERVTRTAAGALMVGAGSYLIAKT